MGNKILESNPIIFGSGKDLSKDEKQYFDRVKTILKNNYNSNLYSDYNLEFSLEQKSFENTHFAKKNIEDISWDDYIINHLNSVMLKYNNAQWASELKVLLSKEVFIYENNYFSNFFYNEYNFKTCPNILNEVEYHFKDNYIDMKNQPLLDLNDSKNNNNGYNELDVTDNLGGSYLEMNMENLDPNDPAVQYRMKRKNLKNYIKIFKEHIYNNQNHPINKVVVLFNNSFCKYINQNIKNFNNQLKGGLLIGDNYDKTIQNFQKEITDCLRNFIITIHTSLKLFYSTTINYECFEEEKDDLINLVTSLFFKTGNLYEKIYSLYSMSFEREVELFQEKLIDLKNVKPKDLGVQIKFCLDEDTLELQRNILKDKQKERDQKDKENIKKDNNEKKDNELFQIKEKDEEEKDNEDENDKNNSNDNIINTNSDTNNNIINTNKNYINNDKSEEGDYLLEKINMNDDISMDMKTDALCGGFIHLRNTINCFNNKKYLFPKIRDNLRDTLALNDKYIREVKENGKLPIPYSSAINLLKNLKSYKTPFEKIVILAALSDQVTESVSSFWSSMTNYVKNSFLFIEADEIMAIFVFIIIKSQMPEMIIESKIITNFTTPSTRAFNISYNLTLMEASIETINKMENTKELANRCKQLKEVRKSIAILTTQRLSRISRLSNQDSPFS